MTSPSTSGPAQRRRMPLRLWVTVIGAVAFTVILGVAPLVSVAVLPRDQALCGFVVKHPNEICVQHSRSATTRRDVEEQRSWNLRGGLILTCMGSVFLGVLVLVGRAVGAAGRDRPANPAPPGYGPPPAGPPRTAEASNRPAPSQYYETPPQFP